MAPGSVSPRSSATAASGAPTSTTSGDRRPRPCAAAGCTCAAGRAPARSWSAAAAPRARRAPPARSRPRARPTRPRATRPRAGGSRSPPRPARRPARAPRRAPESRVGLSASRTATPDRERGDRPARERQVDGHPERRRGRCRGRSEAGAASGVPATRIASVSPSAASTPMPFQYVSGCSSRPAAVADCVQVDQAGKQPARQPVKHHDERAARRAPARPAAHRAPCATPSPTRAARPCRAISRPTSSRAGSDSGVQESDTAAHAVSAAEAGDRQPTPRARAAAARRSQRGSRRAPTRRCPRPCARSRRTRPSRRRARSARRAGQPATRIRTTTDPPDKSGIVTSVLAQAATRPRWVAAAVFAGAVARVGVLDPARDRPVRRRAGAPGGGAHHRTASCPYHDFTWAYGPGQPYLLAGLNELFAPSLLAWRIVRVLVNGAVTVVVYIVLRDRVGHAARARRARSSPRARWRSRSARTRSRSRSSSRCSPWPLRAADEPRPLVAARVHRPGRGMAARLRRSTPVSHASSRSRCGATGARCCFTARTAAAGALLAYLPFLIATGPADMWDALVATGLRDREYWTLPFPLEYDGDFALWPPGTLAHDLKDLLSFYVPLLLVVGLAVARRGGVRAAARARAAVGRAARARRLLRPVPALAHGRLPRDAAARDARAAPARSSRSGARRAGRRRPRSSSSRSSARYVVANRANALFDPPELERLRLDVADGVKAEPEDAAALPRAVATRARARAARRADIRRHAPLGPRADREPALLRACGPAEPDGHGLRPPDIRSRPDARSSSGSRRRRRRRSSAGPIPTARAPRTTSAASRAGRGILDDYLARAYREHAQLRLLRGARAGRMSGLDLSRRAPG